MTMRRRAESMTIGGVRTLVAIDGTWEQCKKMLCWNNDRLKHCTQVRYYALTWHASGTTALRAPLCPYAPSS